MLNNYMVANDRMIRWIDVGYKYLIFFVISQLAEYPNGSRWNFVSTQFYYSNKQHIYAIHVNNLLKWQS